MTRILKSAAAPAAGNPPANLDVSVNDEQHRAIEEFRQPASSQTTLPAYEALYSPKVGSTSSSPTASNQSFPAPGDKPTPTTHGHDIDDFFAHPLPIRGAFGPPGPDKGPHDYDHPHPQGGRPGCPRLGPNVGYGPPARWARQRFYGLEGGAANPMTEREHWAASLARIAAKRTQTKSGNGDGGRRCSHCGKDMSDKRDDVKGGNTKPEGDHPHPRHPHHPPGGHHHHHHHHPHPHPPFPFLGGPHFFGPPPHPHFPGSHRHHPLGPPPNWPNDDPFMNMGMGKDSPGEGSFGGFMGTTGMGMRGGGEFDRRRACARGRGRGGHGMGFGIFAHAHAHLHGHGHGHAHGHRRRRGHGAGMFMDGEGMEEGE